MLKNLFLGVLFYNRRQFLLLSLLKYIGIKKEAMIFLI